MKSLLTGCFALLAVALFARVEHDSLKLSGSVDTYFRANLNSTNSVDNGGTLAPATAFANLPGFALGMVNLVGTYETGKVTAVVDLVVGPRGAEAVFASAAPLNLVNQLYVSYAASERVSFTLGNFNTFLGYEVISPVDNFNYSTSYMFSYGPFSHTGLKADFDLGKGLTGMLGVFNPTDLTDFNPTFDFVYGAQLGYELNNGSVYLNLLTDPSNDFTQVDLTAGYDVTERLYLGLNATNAGDLFAGAALYAQTQVNETLALGVRGEYFTDKTGGILGLEQPDSENSTAVQTTLSANVALGPLTLIPEVRVDVLSYDGFLTDALETNPEMSRSLASFVLAAVYGF